MNLIQLLQNTAWVETLLQVTNMTIGIVTALQIARAQTTAHFFLDRRFQNNNLQIKQEKPSYTDEQQKSHEKILFWDRIGHAFESVQTLFIISQLQQMSQEYNLIIGGIMSIIVGIVGYQAAYADKCTCCEHLDVTQLPKLMSG